ncbi:MAG: IS66 family insertion sequence element accessory protein TnpA [Planctomycetota bacterium]|jgi:hypothetical protein
MRRIDVGARPASRSELAEWYSAALADQAASGMSVAKYAGHLGVSVPTLYQWRRRLGADVGDPVGGNAKLVEVTVARPAAVSGGGLVVRLSGGRRSIEVPRGFDEDDLRRLVTAIESC